MEAEHEQERQEFRRWRALQPELRVAGFGRSPTAGGGRKAGQMLFRSDTSRKTPV